MVISTLRRLRARTVARGAAVGFAALSLLAGAAGAAANSGLIDDDSYQSPTYGYQVEWDAPWEVPSDAAPRTEDGVDFLILSQDGSDLRIVGAERWQTPAEMVDAMIQAFDEQVLDEVKVVDQGLANGVAFATYSGTAETGVRYVIYIEVQQLVEATKFEAGVLRITYVIAPEADVAERLASAMDNVQIDGAPPFVAAGEGASSSPGHHDRSGRDEDDDRDHTRHNGRNAA